VAKPWARASSWRSEVSARRASSGQQATVALGVACHRLRLVVPVVELGDGAADALDGIGERERSGRVRWRVLREEVRLAGGKEVAITASDPASAKAPQYRGKTKEGTKVPFAVKRGWLDRLDTNTLRPVTYRPAVRPSVHDALQRYLPAR
jgi:hypothetical protein